MRFFHIALTIINILLSRIYVLMNKLYYKKFALFSDIFYNSCVHIQPLNFFQPYQRREYTSVAVKKWSSDTPREEITIPS